MNWDKFNTLVSGKSSWIKDAKRRRKWRWQNRIIFKYKVKYYIFKRTLNKNHNRILKKIESKLDNYESN